jgi:hypothetical protein
VANFRTNQEPNEKQTPHTCGHRCTGFDIAAKGTPNTSIVQEHTQRTQKLTPLIQEQTPRTREITPRTHKQTPQGDQQVFRSERASQDQNTVSTASYKRRRQLQPLCTTSSCVTVTSPTLVLPHWPVQFNITRVPKGGEDSLFGCR